MRVYGWCCVWSTDYSFVFEHIYLYNSVYTTEIAWLLHFSDSIQLNSFDFTLYVRKKHQQRIGTWPYENIGTSLTKKSARKKITLALLWILLVNFIINYTPIKPRNYTQTKGWVRKDEAYKYKSYGFFFDNFPSDVDFTWKNNELGHIEMVSFWRGYKWLQVLVVRYGSNKKYFMLACMFPTEIGRPSGDGDQSIFARVQVCA